MTDWQPIETAPKDKPILGFGTRWQGEISGVHEGQFYDIIEGGPGARTDREHGDKWWSCITGDAYAVWLEATHWMPLPEPPND